MRVKSIGGLENDGIVYVMWLESPYSQPAFNLQLFEPTYRDARVARARRQPLTMQLHVSIGDVPGMDEAREALLATLDTAEAAVQLVVEDDEGGNERYRRVVAGSPGEEQPDSAGMGAHFVATLVTHGDVAWTRVAESVVNWSPTASGATVAVTNGGSLAARPTITLTPREHKEGETWAYRRFVTVRWESWQPFERYPMNLTWGAGGAFNTAQLVVDGKIASEDEIGVIVDGAEARRWVALYDGLETKVWVNLDFQPGQSVRLGVGFGSGDVVGSLTVDAGQRRYLGQFPVEGLLQIGEELFRYAGLDLAAGKFLNVERAVNGSVAAEHEADDTVWWIQHEIWLVYGDQTRRTEFGDRLPNGMVASYDSYKPMIDLGNSSNGMWVWDTMVALTEAERYRPLAWQGMSEGGHVTATSLDGAWVTLSVGAAATLSGNSASWRVPAVLELEQMDWLGTRFQGEPGRWEVGILTAGQPGVSLLISVGQPAQIGTMENYSMDARDLPLRDTRFIAFMERNTSGSAASMTAPRAIFRSEPWTGMTAEEAAYSMDVLLENLTTGLGLRARLEMALDQSLVIDTEGYWVTLSDGSSQYQAVEKDSRRVELFPLAPGANTIRLTEVGLAGMDVQVKFRAMTYS